MTTIESASTSERHDIIFSSIFPGPEIAILKQDFASANSTSKETLAAWDLVTSWLHLPRDGNENISHARSSSRLDGALSRLLSNDEMSSCLVDWFSTEVQRYQDLTLKPKLQALWSSKVACSQAADILSQTLDLLISSYDKVLIRIDHWLASHGSTNLAQAVSAIRSAVLERSRANALHRLPSKRLLKTVSFVLHAYICAWLLPAEGQSSGVASKAIQSLLVRLHQSGLGGDSGQRAFAHAMNAVMDSYVQSSAIKVDWVGRESVTGNLRKWIRETFIPMARDGLQCLTGETGTAFFETETTEWENVAFEKLAKQRIKYLFEYVRAWDHSAGAIMDLKGYIQTAAEGKLLLANAFEQQMAERILHAGVTTSELLSMYINVIDAFKALDPRGVLLDKVAGPLRSYLRQRDDTVRIIAASFLADVDQNGNVTNPSDEVCSDLAREIQLSEGIEMKVDEKGLDWDDMAWVPDPIDAGPDYKRSKSDDVMSFMLTLFERGDFIQEVQALLGERLLTEESATSDLEKEILLVELFKTRFGPDGLQSCEVMLRDILESKRINTTLRPSDDADIPTVQEVHAATPEDGITLANLRMTFQSQIPFNSTANQQFLKIIEKATVKDRASGLLYPRPDVATSVDDSARFSTLILSSFFWPSLREDEFDVPKPISAMQKSFEQDFERIKNLRKLHWLAGLGRVTVQLDFEDRSITVERTQTWQASVIYAFQNEDEDGGGTGDSPVKKTVQGLVDSLSMDELLVRDAIALWLHHRAIVEVGPDTYQVLEEIPSASADSDNTGASAPAQILAPPPPAPRADAAISAIKSQDAVLRDNKETYELFMVGMLTNGGAMDAPRITMMMKMVVPGGYAFGEDETRWLLADLAQQGKVVENGSSYAIKK